MAQVLPAERDLHRVIGDGEDIPDGEVGAIIWNHEAMQVGSTGARLSGRVAVQS